MPLPAIEINGICKTYHGWWGRSAGNAVHALAMGYSLAFLYFFIALFLFSLALGYSRKQGILTRLSE